jgi:hypothetical protein
MVDRRIFCNYISGMNEPKRGRGRPPKPPDETKSLVYQMRLTEAERAEYQAAAKRAKLKLAAWIRQSLASAARQTTNAQ